ncbi:MAG: hypothetical protein AAF741_18705, partial [Bacteroidota bacterium]
MRSTVLLVRTISVCAFLILSFSVHFLFAQIAFQELQKVVHDDREELDGFGLAVSISGNQAIVGAPLEANDVAGSAFLNASGSAYILEQDDSGNWSQSQKLVASDRQEGDQFGFSVAISGDYAVVGAWAEDPQDDMDNELSFAGSAYVFEKDDNGNWAQVQKLIASDREAGDFFGWSVSISGDFVVVGARNSSPDYDSGDPLITAGAAYIFKRDEVGSWNEEQKLLASDRDTGDLFGASVSISGSTLVVGSTGDEGENQISDAGAVYVFELSDSGSWQESEKLVAATMMQGDDQFGEAVSINEDYIIVGSPMADTDASGENFLGSAGSVHIFERNSNSEWNFIQKIVPGDRQVGDRFGNSVSISGNRLVAGASTEDNEGPDGSTLFSAGSAYIFERDDSGTWLETQKLVATDREQGDNFGTSVSISGDVVISGTPNHAFDSSGGDTLQAAGAAFIFLAVEIPPCEEVTFANLPATPLTVECDDIPAVAVVTATIEQDEIIDPFVFVSEFHYDNGGGDVGEFIEVTGTAGFNLDGYSLELYNGNGGASYNTFDLSGNIIDNEGNGYGAISIATPSIQNGSPDGFALVDDAGVVVQFLSYEGSFTATDGPAEGLTSTDVGVVETGGTAIGESLQLTGTGCTDADFSWNPPAADSPGDLNDGLVFDGCPTSAGGPVAVPVGFMEEITPGSCANEFTITRTYTV